MSQEWVLAGVIIATPFVLFGAFEAVGAIRRRRAEAIARRPKGVRRATPDSRRSRAG